MIFTFRVWAETFSTCWPGPRYSGKKELDPFHSLEHKAPVNEKFLFLETHKQRSLEGEGSDVCTEDPYTWNMQEKDCWQDNSKVVGEEPSSLELANGGSLKRRFWSCCRRWGALSLWSLLLFPNSPNPLLAELPCFFLEQLSLATCSSSSTAQHT